MMEGSESELLHQAVWFQDHATIAQVARERPELLNALDRHGNTPLVLAIRLGYDETAHFLLSKGADPRVRTRGGWTVLQQAACVGKGEDMLRDMYLHTLVCQAEEWASKLPDLRRRMAEAPDFYMELSWVVESWIPFVSTFSPHDTFRIWKKGAKLRFDSDTASADEESAMSLIFHTDSIFVVDRETKSCADALAHFRNPSFDRIERRVRRLLDGSDRSRTSSMVSTKNEFVDQLTLLGYPAEETVLGRECSIVDLTGFAFKTVALRRDLDDDDGGSGGGEADAIAAEEKLDFNDYFSDSASSSGSGDGDEARDPVSARLETDTKDVHVSMSLPKEPFPLSPRELSLVLEIVAPAQDDLRVLRDILAAKLPRAFPLKMVVPILPTTQVAATVTVFDQERDISDDVFKMPKDFHFVS